MLAKDLMTTEPVSVTVDTLIGKAIGTMLQHAISGLPVLDDKGHVCGILTEGDLLQRSPLTLSRQVPPEQPDDAFYEAYLLANGTTVGDCMTRTVHSVPPDMPVAKLVTLMRSQNVKRLPVIDQDRLVGIVSRRDVIRAISSGRDRTARGDDSLRLAVVTRLRSELGLGPDQVDVKVRNALVEVTGELASQAQRRAIHVVAESVAGIEGVVIVPLTGGMPAAPQSLSPAG